MGDFWRQQTVPVLWLVWKQGSDGIPWQRWRSFLGELPSPKRNRGPLVGVIGEGQNTRRGAYILCRSSERLQEAAMGQAGIRGSKCPESQRDQGAATTRFPELN